MDLKTKAIKSTAWYLSTRIWTQVLSWGVTLVLARLLVPQDYGLFAMAFAVIQFLELFHELGLGVSIIRKQDLSQKQLNTLFWIIVTTSLAIVLLLCAGAEIVASFYHEPRLTWIIRILSLIFLLNSFGMVPYSLLTKEINFRSRSLAEAAGVAVSAVFSLSVAYLGFGVWALVTGQLVRAAIKNTMMAICCGWRPGLDIGLADAKEHIKFGLRLTGSNVVSAVSSFLTTAIVGRLLGGHDLGLYSMAASLGRSNPLHNFSTAVINQLSLPVFSQLQSDEKKLRTYFLKITKYLAVIAFPLQIGMALVANDLVLFLLSDQWLPIVGLLQVFALGGVFYILPLPAAPVLTARGRAGTVFKFSCLSAAATTSAYLVGVQRGLFGLGLAWIIVFPLQRIYLLSLSLNEISLRMKDYLWNIGSPLLATGAMASCVLLVRYTVTNDLSTLEKLAFEIAAGGITYGAVLFLIDRRFGAEVREVAQDLFAVSRA